MAETNHAPDNRASAPGGTPPKLRLPFMRRRVDAGTLVYKYRAGICITLIVYLIIGIIFVGSRVVVKAPVRTDGILLDMRTLEELQKEHDRLEREVRMRQQGADDNAYVRNAVSNEGAELRDDRNTDVSSLRDRADNLDGKMQSNRDAWEQGMQDIASMRSDKGDGKEASKTDSRARGTVLVSFSLIDPLRYAGDVITPGYMCEREGEVVVNITVNWSGNVVSASIDRSLSDSDNCMHETALDAARRSRFTLDSSAPERQSGTITYRFVAQ